VMYAVKTALVSPNRFLFAPSLNWLKGYAKFQIEKALGEVVGHRIKLALHVLYPLLG
jgi:hypothetical protein